MKVPFTTRLALRQLRYKGLALIGTFAGVCVAITLVFVQLGIQNALLNSVLNVDRALVGDIVIAGPQFETIGYSPPWFARGDLYRAKGVPGVADVVPLYAFVAQVRTPDGGKPIAARFLAFDPAQPALQVPGLTEWLPHLRLPNAALLDERSRQQFIPIVEALQAGQPQTLYLQSAAATLAPKVNFISTFNLGPDFAIAGSVITSDLNYFRIFQFPLDRVSFGLVTVAPGYDLVAVRNGIREVLGDRAQVSLRTDFIDAERTYFNTQTPIGVIFGFGIAIGILIGIVFVFEVLHGIIDANVSEYAVLRAMGYEDGFFIALVLQIATAIAVLAFIPSIVLTEVLYRLLSTTTRLRFELDVGTSLLVLGATLVMSAIAVLFALRKLRSSNPIELFS